jgi:hypothetical protein
MRKPPRFPQAAWTPGLLAGKASGEPPAPDQWIRMVAIASD